MPGVFDNPEKVRDEEYNAAVRRMDPGEKKAFLIEYEGRSDPLEIWVTKGDKGFVPRSREAILDALGDLYSVEPRPYSSGEIRAELEGKDLPFTEQRAYPHIMRTEGGWNISDFTDRVTRYLRHLEEKGLVKGKRVGKTFYWEPVRK